MSFKAVRDYICPNCNYYILDIYGDFEDVHTCERCDTTMVFLPTRANVDTHFAGSHNSEYNGTNKVFEGTTKIKVLESLEKDAKDYIAMKKKRNKE